MKLILLATFIIFYLPSNSYAKDQDVWHEFHSENFILRTNADEETGRTAIENLEKYRAVLGYIVGLDMSHDPNAPLLVFGFKKTREYIDEMDMANTVGFYTDQLTGPVSALSLERREKFWEFDGLEVIFHEYNHHLLWRYSPYIYPRWYSEGFAEFTSTMRFEDDKAIIGAPVADRLSTLQKRSYWYQLKDLMQAKSTLDGDWNGQYNGAMLYAQGWVTTHFFQNTPKYQETFINYLELLNQSGVTEKEAFEKAFQMDRYDLEVEIKKYWYSYKLPYLAVKVSDLLPEIKFSHRILPPTEAAVIPSEARILTDQGLSKRRRKLAREQIRKALEAGIRPAEMHILLARLAKIDEDWPAVLEQAELALAAGGRDADAFSLKGEAILGDPLLAGEDKDDAYRHTMAKQFFGKAIKANNRYLPALMAYARLGMEKEQTVSKAQLKVIASARFLAPSNTEVMDLQVDLLAKAGKYDAAIEQLSRLTEWAWRPRRFKHLLKRMETLKKEQAAAIENASEG